MGFGQESGLLLKEDIMDHLLGGVLALSVVVGASATAPVAKGAEAEDGGKLSEKRIAAVADMLDRKPAGFGRPISDRVRETKNAAA